MINASNLSLKYGDRVLLNNISLSIRPRDKMGLVGRNGAGKSTLLKILASEVTPDSGQIAMPNNATLGFLHQEMNLPLGKTVLAETLTAFHEVKKLEKVIDKINKELEVRTDYESDSYAKLIDKLTDASDRFEVLGGSSMEKNAEKVLTGLGFKQSDFTRLVDEFSGGWQMRIELAKMLLQSPDYLLLDEPTNHLDIESIIWLEEFLQNYPGAVILISHDKQFLDNITNRTVEIELGNMYDYKAPYSKYIEMRKERKTLQEAAYKNQQKVIAQREKTINRFMAKATKTNMAQSMRKQLDKIERIEIEKEDTATMTIKFPPAPRSGQVVVELKKLIKKYGDLLVLNGVDLKMDRGDRVSFVGQNGQGKTTLAKIIVNELNHTGGDLALGHNVKIGYYAQNQSDTLHQNYTVLQTIELKAPPELRPRVRGILGAFMFSGEDVEKKVSVLSGGERARLALACLLLKPINLLVLDEPTNHLDMLSKEVLKKAIQAYDGSLIVVSHDRDFLAGLSNRTIEFRNKRLYEYLGDVNYFLEKRALDNMREVELSKSKSAHAPKGKTANANKNLNRDLSKDDAKEKKRLQRAIDNAERKIESLESEIEVIETKMGEQGFYESADAQKLIDKHSELKKELDNQMANWESATEKLEAF